MSSPVIRFETLLALTAGSLLAGCSLLSQSFSQTVDPAERARVLAKVHVGMPMEEAESAILGLGYRCSSGHGSFVDERGDEREAARFLACEERPAAVDFRCLNRNQVYVIPSGGMTDEIHVTRGPSCAKN